MVSGKTSIIIAARNELYLNPTIENILKNSEDETEVIVVMDGYWPRELPKEDKRLILVHRERQGMKASINSAVQMCSGQYILKIDAHCIISEGFDHVLKQNCDKDDVVTIRRYSLNPDTWDIKRDKDFVDYEYLRFPYELENKAVHGSRVGIHAENWKERTISRIDRLIDNQPTFQGSFYFMHKEHFVKRIEGLDEKGFGTFVGEAQQIGLKTWLGGGRCLINKKLWYSHLWKGKPYREAHLKEIGTPYTRIGQKELKASNAFCVDYFMHDRWKDRKHNLEWLIDKFDMPTWPKDWMKEKEKYNFKTGE